MIKILKWENNCTDGWHWLRLRPFDRRCRRQFAYVYESHDRRTYVRLADGRVLTLQDLRNLYPSARWAGPLPEPESEG